MGVESLILRQSLSGCRRLKIFQEIGWQKMWSIGIRMFFCGVVECSADVAVGKWCRDESRAVDQRC